MHPRLVVVAALATCLPAQTETKDTKKELGSDTFAGLKFRSLGPAVCSGRIGDLARHPKAPSTWFVAVASGGVWKTTNAGTTWTPVFDSQASYSIGCVAIDPQSPHVVWVGSGENNSQRSVSYGDGVYRSLDGGKSWDNLGLRGSEHIGRIVIDPRSSDTVYVAAQGPLWNDGGDRGLYKTTDGGRTWARVLHVTDKTGINEVHMDPRDPRVLYATSYQRRRHVWTLIDGGPESAIWKSTDAGATWRKLTSGLPVVDLGRIGLALSPANPDVLYAIVEAARGEGGVFRSANGGATWEKTSSYMATSPQYYNELVADPADVDRVYSLDTYLMVSVDGGKTFQRAGEKSKHVDNHSLWIDPADPTHLLCGSDGGLYESFDRCATWRFFENLPVTQFYRVAVDNDKPFYNVYGGTQDNATLGGPSRTTSTHGIVNADWFITVFGDGFKPAIDPEDPDIVYSQWQHGGLVRYDRKTGEKIDIKPQAGRAEPPLRWNWDSPLIISPHLRTRLYFAAQRVFRSDDRGSSWRAVSGDLTRQVDRNQLKVMDRVWSVDAVAKNASTSFYGNLVSLAESPKVEGLLYTGADDGLIQATDDGGQSWRKIENLPGVPANSYVSDLVASQHQADRVFAAFDNHKMGDFKPYLLRSDDRGRTWSAIAGNLPERGTVYSLAEDHENDQLLFCGTEFGVWVTLDGGSKWIQLKGGLPTIAVRHVVIQKRESDLVLATFGRGFYVLDDYSPLRKVKVSELSLAGLLLPVKTAYAFIEREPLGLPGKAFQGETWFTASNPAFGAVFTWYLPEELKSRRKQRQEAEQKLHKEGKDVSYPSWDDLRAEDAEEAPAVVLTVSDEAGNVVRRLLGSTGAGFHRVAWDLRFPASNPVEVPARPRDDQFSPEPSGHLAMPGSYRVALSTRVGGKEMAIGEPQAFAVVPLHAASLPAPDQAELLAFQRKTWSLQRAVLGALRVAGEARSRLDHLQKAIQETPGQPTALAEDARAIAARLRALQVSLSGDGVVARANEPTPPSVVERVRTVVGGHWDTTSAPTETHRKSYDLAAEEFTVVLEKLQVLVETDLRSLESRCEAAGAPWTPGRVPRWQR